MSNVTISPSKISPGKVHSPVRKKCGKCKGCLAPRCGRCKFCVDVVKFSGSGKNKETCVFRTCESMEESLKPDVSVSPYTSRRRNSPNHFSLESSDQDATDTQIMKGQSKHKKVKKSFRNQAGDFTMPQFDSNTSISRVSKQRTIFDTSQACVVEVERIDNIYTSYICDRQKRSHSLNRSSGTEIKICETRPKRSASSSRLDRSYRTMFETNSVSPKKSSYTNNTKYHNAIGACYSEKVKKYATSCRTEEQRRRVGQSVFLIEKSNSFNNDSNLDSVNNLNNTRVKRERGRSRYRARNTDISYTSEESDVETDHKMTFHGRKFYTHYRKKGEQRKPSLKSYDTYSGEKSSAMEVDLQEYDSSDKSSCPSDGNDEWTDDDKSPEYECRKCGSTFDSIDKLEYHYVHHFNTLEKFHAFLNSQRKTLATDSDATENVKDVADGTIHSNGVADTRGVIKKKSVQFTLHKDKNCKESSAAAKRKINRKQTCRKDVKSSDSKIETFQANKNPSDRINPVNLTKESINPVTYFELNGEHFKTSCSLLDKKLIESCQTKRLTVKLTRVKIEKVMNADNNNKSKKMSKGRDKMEIKNTASKNVKVISGAEKLRPAVKKRKSSVGELNTSLTSEGMKKTELKVYCGTRSRSVEVKARKSLGNFFVVKEDLIKWNKEFEFKNMNKNLFENHKKNVAPESKHGHIRIPELLSKKNINVTDDMKKENPIVRKAHGAKASLKLEKTKTPIKLKPNKGIRKSAIEKKIETGEKSDKEIGKKRCEHMHILNFDKSDNGYQLSKHREDNCDNVELKKKKSPKQNKKLHVNTCRMDVEKRKSDHSHENVCKQENKNSHGASSDQLTESSTRIILNDEQYKTDGTSLESMDMKDSSMDENMNSNNKIKGAKRSVNKLPCARSINTANDLVSEQKEDEKICRKISNNNLKSNELHTLFVKIESDNITPTSRGIKKKRKRSKSDKANQKLGEKEKELDDASVEWCKEKRNIDLSILKREVEFKRNLKSMRTDSLCDSNSKQIQKTDTNQDMNQTTFDIGPDVEVEEALINTNGNLNERTNKMNKIGKTTATNSENIDQSINQSKTECSLTDNEKDSQQKCFVNEIKELITDSNSEKVNLDSLNEENTSLANIRNTTCVDEIDGYKPFISRSDVKSLLPVTICNDVELEEYKVKQKDHITYKKIQCTPNNNAETENSVMYSVKPVALEIDANENVSNRELECENLNVNQSVLTTHSVERKMELDNNEIGNSVSTVNGSNSNSSLTDQSNTNVDIEFVFRNTDINKMLSAVENESKEIDLVNTNLQEDDAFLLVNFLEGDVGAENEDNANIHRHSAIDTKSICQCLLIANSDNGAHHDGSESLDSAVICPSTTVSGKYSGDTSPVKCSNDLLSKNIGQSIDSPKKKLDRVVDKLTTRLSPAKELNDSCTKIGFHAECLPDIVNLLQQPPMDKLNDQTNSVVVPMMVKASHSDSSVVGQLFHSPVNRFDEIGFDTGCDITSTEEVVVGEVLEASPTKKIVLEATLNHCKSKVKNKNRAKCKTKKKTTKGNVLHTRLDLKDEDISYEEVNETPVLFADADVRVVTESVEYPSPALRSPRQPLDKQTVVIASPTMLMHQCETCKRRYKSFENLFYHWRDTEHRNETLEPITTHFFCCSFCGLKFVVQSRMLKHEIICSMKLKENEVSSQCDRISATCDSNGRQEGWKLDVPEQFSANGNVSELYDTKDKSQLEEKVISDIKGFEALESEKQNMMDIVMTIKKDTGEIGKDGISFKTSFENIQDTRQCFFEKSINKSDDQTDFGNETEKQGQKGQIQVLKKDRLNEESKDDTRNEIEKQGQSSAKSKIKHHYAKESFKKFESDIQLKGTMNEIEEHGLESTQNKTEHDSKAVEYKNDLKDKKNESGEEELRNTTIKINFKHDHAKEIYNEVESEQNHKNMRNESEDQEMRRKQMRIKHDHANESSEKVEFEKDLRNESEEQGLKNTQHRIKSNHPLEVSKKVKLKNDTLYVRDDIKGERNVQNEEKYDHASTESDKVKIEKKTEVTTAKVEEKIKIKVQNNGIQLCEKDSPKKERIVNEQIHAEYKKSKCYTNNEKQHLIKERLDMKEMLPHSRILCTVCGKNIKARKFSHHEAKCMKKDKPGKSLEKNGCDIDLNFEKKEVNNNGDCLLMENDKVPINDDLRIKSGLKVVLKRVKMSSFAVNGMDLKFYGSVGNPCWKIKTDQIALDQNNKPCINLAEQTVEKNTDFTNASECYGKYVYSCTSDTKQCNGETEGTNDNVSLKLGIKRTKIDTEKKIMSVKSECQGHSSSKDELDKNNMKPKSLVPQVIKTGDREKSPNIKGSTKKKDKLKTKRKHSDVSPSLTDFEKALIPTNESKRDKTSKEKSKKQKLFMRQTSSDSDPVLESTKDFVKHKERHEHDVKKTQPFFLSKTAQKIYFHDKKRKEESLSFDDGLPDFSSTTMTLEHLPPLSVSDTKHDKELASKHITDTSIKESGSFMFSQSPFPSFSSPIKSVKPGGKFDKLRKLKEELGSLPIMPHMKLKDYISSCSVGSSFSSPLKRQRHGDHVSMMGLPPYKIPKFSNFTDGSNSLTFQKNNSGQKTSSDVGFSTNDCFPSDSSHVYKNSFGVAAPTTFIDTASTSQAIDQPSFAGKYEDMAGIETVRTGLDTPTYNSKASSTSSSTLSFDESLNSTRDQNMVCNETLKNGLTSPADANMTMSTCTSSFEKSCNSATLQLQKDAPNKASLSMLQNDDQINSPFKSDYPELISTSRQVTSTPALPAHSRTNRTKLMANFKTTVDTNLSLLSSISDCSTPGTVTRPRRGRIKRYAIPLPAQSADTEIGCVEKESVGNEDGENHISSHHIHAPSKMELEKDETEIMKSNAENFGTNHSVGNRLIQPKYDMCVMDYDNSIEEETKSLFASSVSSSVDSYDKILVKESVATSDVLNDILSLTEDLEEFDAAAVEAVDVDQDHELQCDREIEDITLSDIDEIKVETCFESDVSKRKLNAIYSKHHKSKTSISRKDKETVLNGDYTCREDEQDKDKLEENIESSYTDAKIRVEEQSNIDDNSYVGDKTNIENFANPYKNNKNNDTNATRSSLKTMGCKVSDDVSIFSECSQQSVNNENSSVVKDKRKGGTGNVRKEVTEVMFCEDDIVDLYASDEDASFLCIDSPDEDVNSRQSSPCSTLCERQSPVISSHGDGEKKEIKVSPRDMDIDLMNNAEEQKIEVNSPVDAVVDRKHQQPQQSQRLLNQQHLQRQQQQQQQQLQKPPWLPPGHCYRYLSGRSCTQNPCTYRHEHLTPELLRPHLSKIHEKFNKGDLAGAVHMLRSHELFQMELDAPTIYKMYKECLVTRQVELAHRLVRLMYRRHLLYQVVIDDFIYMYSSADCGQLSNYLWDVFNIAKTLNIQPIPRSSNILLWHFSEMKAWAWLWEVMLYSTEDEGYVIPLEFVHPALASVIDNPAFVEVAIKWLYEADLKLLQDLSPQLLEDVCKVLSRFNCPDMVTTLRHMVHDSRNNQKQSYIRPARPSTPPTPSVNDRVKVGPSTPTGPCQRRNTLSECSVQSDMLLTVFKEDEKDVGLLVKNILSVAFTKSWDYLADLFMDRSMKQIPIAGYYIEKFVIALTKDMSQVDKGLKEFLDHVMSKYELAKSVNAQLDRHGLSVIAYQLFRACYTEKRWSQGYNILKNMKQRELLIKNSDILAEMAVPALQTCIHDKKCFFALDILDVLDLRHADADMTCEILTCIHHLLEQFIKNGSLKDCYKIIQIAFALIHKGKRPLNLQKTKLSLTDASSTVIGKCLMICDVETASNIYKLFIQYCQPFPVIAVLKRALLVAMCDSRIADLHHYTSNLYERLKKENVYLPQSVGHPRVIILEKFFTPTEVYLVVNDYIQCLYNKLCEQTMENNSLTRKDLHLKIAFGNRKLNCKHSHMKFPYMDEELSPPVIQKILQCQFEPPLQTILNLHDDTLLVNPESLKHYIKKHDNRMRRQGIRFQ